MTATIEDITTNVFRRDLLHLLINKAFEKREVTLASGRKSNFYIDCRRVTLSAQGHWLVGILLNKKIHEAFPRAVAVGGLTMGADPIASAVSTLSHTMASRSLDAFYIRKEAKKHGTGQLIEGARDLPKGAGVIIVDDVVTSGGSSLFAVEKAQEAGLCPVAVLALVDRLEGGGEKIRQHLPLYSLFTRDDFMPGESEVIL